MHKKRTKYACIYALNIIKICTLNMQKYANKNESLINVFSIKMYIIH